MKRSNAIKIIAAAFLLAIIAIVVIVIINKNKSHSETEWRLVNNNSIEAEYNGQFLSYADNKLSFLDYGTMQQSIVCADPTCKHEEKCTANDKTNHAFIYDKKIYYFKTTDMYQNGENTIITDIELWNCDLDGSNEKKLTTFEGYDYPTYERLLLTDDTAYFFLISTPKSLKQDELKGKATFFSYELASGKSNNYGDVVSGFSCDVVVYGIWDNKIIYRTACLDSDKNATDLLNDFMKENGYKNTDEALENFSFEHKTQMYSFDLKTHEISKYDSMNDIIAIGKSYYLSDTNSKLTITDEKDNTVTLDSLNNYGNVAALKDEIAVNADGGLYIYSVKEQKLYKSNAAIVYFVTDKVGEDFIVTHQTDDGSNGIEKLSRDDLILTEVG